MDKDAYLSLGALGGWRGDCYSVSRGAWFSLAHLVGGCCVFEEAELVGHELDPRLYALAKAEEQVSTNLLSWTSAGTAATVTV